MELKTPYSVNISIGKFLFEVFYDNLIFGETVKKYFAHYVDTNDCNSNEKIRFQIFHFMDESNLKYEPIYVQSDCLRYYLEGGTNCYLDVEKLRITIFLEKSHSREYSLLYHDSLILPIYGAFKLFQHRILHSALVSYDSKGILISGCANSGKSSISVACILAGYKFYGDEHPVLKVESNIVYGESFYTSIRLNKGSRLIERLDSLAFKWDQDIHRYSVDPLKLEPRCLGLCTGVNVVVFPTFVPGGAFKVEKISSYESNMFLLQDSYFSRDYQSPIARDLTIELENFFRTLSRTTVSYRMQYSNSDVLERIPTALMEL